MRRLLMIALAGMASLAMTGTEAQAHGGYGNRGISVGIGNYWGGRSSSFYRGGFNSPIYRGNHWNQYRNPYQSIPRPNPYYGGYRTYYGGGFGGYGGYGCRR